MISTKHPWWSFIMTFFRKLADLSQYTVLCLFTWVHQHGIQRGQQMSSIQISSLIFLLILLDFALLLVNLAETNILTWMING